MTLNTRQRAWLLALLATATVLLANRSNASTLSTWNGTTANWSDPTRWSTNPFYPNNGNGAAEYAAVIGGGTVNLNVDVVLSSLTLNGGTLSGGGNISTGTFALTNSATLSTTGTFNANSVNLEGGLLARDLTLPTTASNPFTSTQIGAGATLTVPVGSTLNFNFPGPG